MSIELFETWLSDFEEHLFSRRPVDATFAGKYEYNHLLTEVSCEGLELVLNEIKSLLSRSEKIDTKSLNRYQRIDFDLIRGFLSIQLWERESGYIFNINPTTYSSEAVFSLVSLFISDFRAASQKQEDLEAR